MSGVVYALVFTSCTRITLTENTSLSLHYERVFPRTTRKTTMFTHRLVQLCERAWCTLHAIATTVAAHAVWQFQLKCTSKTSRAVGSGGAANYSGKLPGSTCDAVRLIKSPTLCGIRACHALFAITIRNSTRAHEEFAGRTRQACACGIRS